MLHRIRNKSFPEFFTCTGIITKRRLEKRLLRKTLERRRARKNIIIPLSVIRKEITHVFFFVVLASENNFL